MIKQYQQIGYKERRNKAIRTRCRHSNTSMPQLVRTSRRAGLANLPQIVQEARPTLASTWNSEPLPETTDSSHKKHMTGKKQPALLELVAFRNSTSEYQETRAKNCTKMTKCCIWISFLQCGGKLSEGRQKVALRFKKRWQVAPEEFYWSDILHTTYYVLSSWQRKVTP